VKLQGDARLRIGRMRMCSPMRLPRRAFERLHQEIDK
jgi:hypothetical protein